MKKFFESSTREYNLVSNEYAYLIDQYAQIQQFITSNFPEAYHRLLAKPERRDNRIEWYTEVPGEFKKVELFEPYEKTALLNIYNARRHEINNKCNALGLSEDYDRRSWADILKGTFHPDQVQLFSNGTETVLIWGVKTMKQNDYMQPFESFSSLIIPVNPILGEEGLDPNVDGNINETDELETVNEVPDNSEISDESNVVASEDDGSSVADPSDEGTSNDTLSHYDTSGEDLNETDGNISDPVAEETEVISPPIRPKVIKSKPPFYRALDAFEVFAKRFWWLLLLLLILLMFFLFKTCTGPQEDQLIAITDEEIEEVYDEIMPEEPRKRIIPIDTTDFQEDDNGMIILSGMLNIAMVDKKDKFKRMAVELKQAFPGEEYKIVYYDEETHRLQFDFPEEDNDAMAEKIRTKLSSYELLIWNESVFANAKLSNDPFMKIEEKSWHYKDVQLEKAWDISQGDTSVYIAVVDDGFDLKHAEFKGKHIKYPYNVVTQDRTVFGNDEIKHGTHVAALATGSSDNGQGASGVAPKCTFIPVQISDGGAYFSSTNIIDGVLYALNHGADVINMSLGKYFGESLQGKSPGELDEIIRNEGKDEERFWAQLFKMAEEKNAMIILAAGNENLLIGLDPMQRSEAVMKVVAVDSDNKKAEFSNYCRGCFGKEGFISAPGVQIWSAVPGNNYESFDGTSMAAPIVSGAVALMKSVKPSLKNKDILKILKETSKTLNDRSCPPLLQLEKALKKVKK